MSTPEGKVKDKVRRALKSLPAEYHHMPVMNGMGAPGLDYHCCIDQRFVGIETKAPGQQLTPRQKVTAGNIVAAGGIVFVIRDDADIALFLFNARYMRTLSPMLVDALDAH